MKDGIKYVIILVTCRNRKQAEAISEKLLEERLAACVNIIKHVESFFHWQKGIDRANEVLLMIKTRRALFDAVRRAVKDIHSYEVPEIIALPILEGDEEYLTWIKNETQT